MNETERRAALHERPGDRADELLRRWRDTAAEGDPEQFARRLRWLGLRATDTAGAVAYLERRTDPEGQTWAPTLRAILALPTEAAPTEMAPAEESPAFLDAAQPLPFEDVLAPIVQLARRMLNRVLSQDARRLLAPPAWATLERRLLEQLVEVAADALFEEFSQSRPIGHQLLGLFAVPAEDADGGGAARGHYQSFVRTLTDGGLSGVFETYRALGPLLATLVDAWVSATAALVRRLHEDLSALRQQFGAPGLDTASSTGDAPSFVVDAIQCGLSDPHRGGLEVAVLTFTNGARLVYKPRSLGMEAAYADLLDWCNRQGVPLTLMPTATLDRGEYGWMAYVAAEACADAEAARRFYFRTGQLLCLLYALGGSDWHSDNVIAAGEHPAVIDLETLFQPGERAQQDGATVGARWSRPADDLFWSSVLRTGFLPRWELGADGSVAYDLSALGGYGVQASPWPAHVWRAVNTDAMRTDWEHRTLPAGQNAPSLGGAALEPGEYLEEITDGFQAMYRFLLHHRATLVGPDSPLRWFRGQPLRFIFRDTGLYYAVRRRSLSPAALKSEATRALALETLGRAHLVEPDQRGTPEILRAEIEALWRLDIPYLTLPSPDSAALDTGDRMLDGAFASSGLDRAVATLRSLSDADLGRQLALIRGAVAARTARGGPAHASGPKQVRPGRPSPPQPPSPAHRERGEKARVADAHPRGRRTAALSTPTDLGAARLMAAARRLAQQLEAAAVHGPDGHPGWIGLRYLGGADRFQLEPLGDNLYDGACGVALFFAALARADGDAHAATMARDALAPLRGLLQRTDDPAVVAALTEHGIGGMAGVGSLVYALTRVGSLTDDATLLDDAQAAALLIHPEPIAADGSFDVVSGAAGAILALLALYGDTADGSVLAQVVRCGRHLLESRSAWGAGRAWISSDEDRPLTGFSHGAAGIAYSLVRLHTATGVRDFLDAAREAMAFERSVFSEAHANWPDLRRSAASPGGQASEAGPRFGLGWCHGAPGLALGRLGALATLNEPQLRAEIDLALATTEAVGLTGVDQLCCGNLGRAEIMLVASIRLGEARWLEAAQTLTARTLDRAEQTGRYRVHPSLNNHLLVPGHFQGAAGIGYGLLRMAHPDLAPSALLLE